MLQGAMAGSYGLEFRLWVTLSTSLKITCKKILLFMIAIIFDEFMTVVKQLLNIKD